MFTAVPHSCSSPLRAVQGSRHLWTSFIMLQQPREKAFPSHSGRLALANLRRRSIYQWRKTTDSEHGFGRGRSDHVCSHRGKFLYPTSQERLVLISFF
jgi:hypothetical protein